MELQFKDWHQNLVNDCSELGIFYENDAIATNPLIINNNLIQQWRQDLPKLGELARMICLKYLDEVLTTTRDDYKALIRLYLTKPRMPIVMRPDGILANNQLKLIDFNIDSGIGGIWEMDFLQSRFANNPLLNKYQNFQLPNPKDGFLSLLRDIQQAYDLPGKLVIALLGADDFNQFYKDQDYDTCQWIKANTDFDAYAITPELLRREGDYISDGKRNYHLLYRQAALVRSVDNCKDMINLIKQAHATRTLVMSDPIDLSIDHKGIFVLFNAVLSGQLSIPECGHDEKQLIERYIPWTQYLEDKDTVFAGNEYKLKNLLVEQQDKFVIKRCISHAGEHVYFGTELTPDYWLDLIEKTSNSQNEKWVVQENLVSDDYAFDYFDGHTTLTKNQNFVISPFVFGNHLGGVSIRIEQNNFKRVLALPTNSEMATAGVIIL